MALDHKFPPLVLLHGHVGDGPAIWRWQAEGPWNEFTVGAWDAPGAGGSSDPPGSFGMAGYADCLAGIIDQLGLKRPHRDRAVIRRRAGTGVSPPSPRYPEDAAP
jgi:pimeloyl-ACP methyl ester carboxylesterase